MRNNEEDIYIYIYIYIYKNIILYSYSSTVVPVGSRKAVGVRAHKGAVGSLNGQLKCFIFCFVIYAAIGIVGILIGSWALTSLHSIEKMQPRMMVAILNTNLSITITI